MKRVIDVNEIAKLRAEPHLADPNFSRAVIDWQQQYGRHSLPWQQTQDAYRVWLSEIMLQQTQVTAVIPYYQRFLDRFPNVHALAQAASEEVMALWSGLGYYTRARNLHQCAKRVVEQYGGVFPSEPALLQELPGIGRSTAAAIAAFSYGTVAAILDGNVKRVFARVFGIDGYPGSKPIEDAMWQRAQALLPATGIQSYTQGLMDLGATLCTRSKPDCVRCPLQTSCVAYREERTAELPVRKPKQKLKEKHAVMVALLHQDRILMQQRANTGIWGGLLSLPELDGMQEVLQDHLLETAGKLTAAQSFAARFGEVQQARWLPLVSHGFTHFKLHIHVISFIIPKLNLAVAEADFVWASLAQIEQMPLPAPIKELLLILREQALH
jgi:A/G-specific adenine glycosylase